MLSQCVAFLTDFRCRGAIDATDVTQTQLVVERRAGERPARKRAGRMPTGACAREAGGTLSGSGRMTLPLLTLLPLFGFARPAGPNHWPKEDSAVRPARKKRNAVKTPRKCGLPDRAGRSLPAAEARSLVFAALRRLQPANLSDGFITS